MTDRQRVYTEVMRTLKGLMQPYKQGHVVTLVMMITGIVMSKKAQLSVMSSEVPHWAKSASIEKRMHRFVKNDRIDVQMYYMPFAKALLSALSTESLVLAMDGSQVGRGCMTLMVGVVYKQRALPVAWIVYRGSKGHTTAARHIEVLELLEPLLPPDAKVILLGDGESGQSHLIMFSRRLKSAKSSEKMGDSPSKQARGHPCQSRPSALSASISLTSRIQGQPYQGSSSDQHPGHRHLRRHLWRR